MYARQRIRTVLKEIGELADSDFPYRHSRDALVLLESLFQDRLTVLESLEDKNTETSETICSESLLQVFKYLPLLGFILRSTNVRNSFEIYGPLLRLARQVLGDDTRLILSSEWDYSPHVYRPLRSLPNFVLIGLPASESENPLLVPLAGHELGHTTWQRRILGADFDETIWEKIEKLAKVREKTYKDLFGGGVGDLLTRGNLLPAHSWAMRQIEESFCDFFGVRIFAESYLFAFAYLLSPGGGTRSGFYPSLKDRVANLVKVSEKLKFEPLSGFSEWFTADIEPAANEKELFLLKLADEAHASVVEELIEKANEIANSAKVPMRSEEKIATIIKAFEFLTPASGIGDLTNILNAAWQVFDKPPDVWQGVVDDPVDTLTELVFKSIEVLEFEVRTG